MFHSFITLCTYHFCLHFIMSVLLRPHPVCVVIFVSNFRHNICHVTLFIILFSNPNICHCYHNRVLTSPSVHCNFVIYICRPFWAGRYFIVVRVSLTWVASSLLLCPSHIDVLHYQVDSSPPSHPYTRVYFSQFISCVHVR